MRFAYISANHIIITSRRLTRDEISHVFMNGVHYILVTFGSDMDKTPISCWRGLLVVDGVYYIPNLFQLERDNRVRYGDEFEWGMTDMFSKLVPTFDWGMTEKEASDRLVAGALLVGVLIRDENRLSVIFDICYESLSVLTNTVFMYCGCPIATGVKCYGRPAEKSFVDGIQLSTHSAIDVVFVNSSYIIALFEDETLEILKRRKVPDGDSIFEDSYTVKLDCGAIRGAGVDRLGKCICVISGDRYIEYDMVTKESTFEMDGVIDTSFTQMTKKKWVSAKRAK